MAVKLQRLPGRPAELGMYRVIGDLPELAGPGRRVVRDVEAVGVQGPADALRVFRAFPDLDRLALGGIDGLRLDPLADLGLTSLTISGGRQLDLAPLSSFVGLEQLWLLGLEDSRVPDPLVLPASLRSLVLQTSHADSGPAVTAELVRRIAWRAIAALTALDVRSDGTPLHVELAFLRELPDLERLDLLGVRHAGGRSPLEPPFDGLPRGLTWLRFEAVDPERLTEALNQYLPSPAAAVLPLPEGDVHGEPESETGDWSIVAPDPDDPEPVWQTYGSLADAFADVPYEEEHRAALMARERLQAADSECAARIRLDSEADGTGIDSDARSDLEWALRTLGLRGSP